MKFQGTRGIARTLVIVAIVIIVLIVAVAGYVVLSATTTTPTTSSSNTTQSSSSTSAASSSSSSSIPATSSVSSSASSSGTVMSTMAVNFATSNPAVVLGAVPLLIAQQQNIFQRYDPNVKLNFIASIGNVIPAVASGSDQMGIVSNTNIPSAIAAGTNITIVGTFLPSTPFAVFVAADSKINSTAQLKGATWASTQPGSLNDVYLHIFAADNNLGNVTEVTVSSTSAQVTAVISGKATACICSYTTVATITAPGRGQLVRAIANVTTSWPNLYVFTTPAFAQQHPDAVKAVLAGLFATDQIFNTNANNSTINLMLNAYPALSLSGAQLVLRQQVYSTTGATSLSLLQNMVNTMVQYKLISKNLSASAMVTPGFSPITT